LRTLPPYWRWLGLLLATACLVAVVWQFSEGLKGMPEAARRMGLRPFIAASLLFAAGGFSVFVAYIVLARAMGMRDLPWTVFGHVYFVGQLFKYLPGRVWGFAFQVARASDLAPPGQWAALLMVHFVAALAALVAVAASIEVVVGGAELPWSILALALAVLTTAILAVEWRTLRKRLTLGTAIATSVLLHLGAFLQAFALVPLVLALAPDSSASAGLREGGHYLLAWLAGYAAVITPAGLGVREGAFAALSEGLAPAALLTLAAAARVAMMLADLLLGFAFLRYPGGGTRGGALGS